MLNAPGEFKLHFSGVRESLKSIDMVTSVLGTILVAMRNWTGEVKVKIVVRGL